MMLAITEAHGKAEEIFQRLLSFVEKASDEEMRIDQVERELFRQLLALGAEMLQQFIDQTGDGDEGPSVEQDGQELRRFQKRRTRAYRSIFGVLAINRWVYGVREKQRACYVPVDARLGLPEGEQSYVLIDWLQRFCVQNAFSHAVASLQDLLGIQTSARTAERLNRELAESAETFRHSEPLAEEEEILVVTADGKGVPMRRTLEERAGREPTAWRKHHQKRQQEKAAERATKRRGRGQKGARKQMAYVGAAYTIARWRRTADDVLDEILRVQRQADRPKPANKRVWAEMTRFIEGERGDGQPRLFAGLALEASRRDPESEKPLVCLMDGQRSLWHLQQQWLPRSVGILDIFHATEWLWKAAYCFHPEGSRSAEQFVTHYLRMFLEGKVGYAIGGLRRKLTGLSASKRKTLESAIRYFDNNRGYMRYDEYLRQGFPIGSGVVEGACRHLVRDRLEQTGMRWDVEGAQAMLDTRAIYINNQWDDFVEHKIQNEQQRLHARAA